MINLVDTNKASKYTATFFDELSRSGYINSGTVRRYLIYLFLVDFIETLYDYIGEDDYKNIGRAMINLFANDSCLFPYSSFCTNYLKLGSSRFTGGTSLRKHIMVGDNLKRLEVEQLRGK